MPHSPLLVHPSKPDADGRIHAITPDSAGWTYVGFEVYDLPAGATLKPRHGRPARSASSCCRAAPRSAAGGQEFGTIGERASVFDGLPWSVYVPAGSSWQRRGRRPLRTRGLRRARPRATCRPG